MGTIGDCCSGCFVSCTRCLSQIPYASLVAFVLCWAGVGVFAGCMYKALDATLKILTMLLNINIQGLVTCSMGGARGDYAQDFQDPGVFADYGPEQVVPTCVLRMDIVQNVCIAVAVSMGVIAFILLLVGFLSTGATRERIYSGAKARVGGKCSLAFFLVISYVLEYIWLCLFACVSCMTFVFGVLFGYCNLGLPDNARLDLNPWGFLFGNDTRFDPNGPYVLEKPDIDRFCNLSIEGFPMYVAAECAAFVVVISLVHFLVCISANYAHIKDGQKLQDYEDARYMEGEELGAMAKN